MDHNLGVGAVRHGCESDETLQWTEQRRRINRPLETPTELFRVSFLKRLSLICLK